MGKGGSSADDRGISFEALQEKLLSIFAHDHVDVQEVEELFLSYK